MSTLFFICLEPICNWFSLFLVAKFCKLHCWRFWIMHKFYNLVCFQLGSLFVRKCTKLSDINYLLHFSWPFKLFKPAVQVAWPGHNSKFSIALNLDLKSIMYTEKQSRLDYYNWTGKKNTQENIIVFLWDFMTFTLAPLKSVFNS